MNEMDEKKAQSSLTNQLDSEEMDEFARRPSTLPPIGVDLRKYATEDCKSPWVKRSTDGSIALERSLT